VVYAVGSYANAEHVDVAMRNGRAPDEPPNKNSKIIRK
jgi:hypothetical protein